MFPLPAKIETQQVFLPILEEKKISLFVRREDRIHPFVSGNKFRKLKYNIEAAKRQKKDTLLTFGGAFSNHVVATAVAGHMEGLKTIGVIRGEELGKKLQNTLQSNATLAKAFRSGMHLHFVSRDEYRKKTTDDFLDKLRQQYGDFYLLPEGGTNWLAVKGCEEICTDKDSDFNYICVAVGTGGTISGLLRASKKTQKVIGIPVLKAPFLKEEIKKFAPKTSSWHLEDGYHFGGYAKYDEALIAFINTFKRETGIPSDPVYTGKLFFGIIDLISRNAFPENSKVLAIHTGGLQGISGFNKMLAKKRKPLIVC